METNATKVASSWVRPRTDIDDIFIQIPVVEEEKIQPEQNLTTINQEIMNIPSTETGDISAVIDSIKKDSIVKESVATQVLDTQDKKITRNRGNNSSSRKVLTAKEMMARMQEKIAVLDMIDKSLNVDVIVTDSTVDKSVRDILTSYQKELLEVQAKYTEQISNL